MNLRQFFQGKSLKSNRIYRIYIDFDNTFIDVISFYECPFPPVSKLAVHFLRVQKRPFMSAGNTIWDVMRTFPAGLQEDLKLDNFLTSHNISFCGTLSDFS